MAIVAITAASGIQYWIRIPRMSNPSKSKRKNRFPPVPCRPRKYIIFYATLYPDT
jgi:hypothetical protein